MSIKTLSPVVLAALLAGCGHSTPEKTNAPSSAPPVAVTAVAAASEQWPSVYEASGTVRARTAAVVSAKVMGYVREVRFQVGDRVRAGQPLIVLEASDLEAGARRAAAGVEEAKAAVPEADNGVAAAKAQLGLAQVTFKRMSDLFAKKSISNQEYDEAQARLKAAEAGYQMAVAKRRQLDAKIAQASEERRSAEIMRGYAQLTAPFSGVVTARTVEPGNLAAPGAPLATIERDGDYRLEVPVEESRVGSIRAGHTATVDIEALGRTIQARVSEVVPAVDAASRSYTVKIDLPSSPQLRSGMFGRARFTVGARPALVVPAAAVITRGQLQSVMVADNGVARTRLITTGQRQQGKVEALSGLVPGESVIAPVPMNLTDGARVEVRR